MGNDMNAMTVTRIQNMSKVQVIRIFLYERVQKYIQGGFVRFQECSSVLFLPGRWFETLVGM